MLISNELRWFYPGKLPEDIKLWFQQNCLIDPLQSPEAREDIYLYSPGCDYLGIKLRQGRLEVKWRQAEFSVVRFGESVAGQPEKWGKWLCEDSTQESFQPAMVLGNPLWVSVQKVRYSQLFQVLADLTAQPVSDQERIANGCRVEITNLVIQENAWWSLAFEAFGENNYLMENLQATASWVFNTYQGTRLLIIDSYAYPHWLGLVYR
ncbi:MAG: hypothetical protein KME32_01875 [Mojavia pulchra JT2-VF2]|jgi:hypothetical protein|uniref:Uncharacterized protein n=1 Tax=Mojavia pulchra JT2-VF2 TaxID=287848 RepID=A0A951PUS5_9NOST|nr:hypothetical protein [Mojavia pulchra JT2-VF2]